MILAEDIERLTVMDSSTNEELAVITDDSVTTAREGIVVRIQFKPRSEQQSGA